jgi:hypothetical protein
MFMILQVIVVFVFCVLKLISPNRLGIFGCFLNLLLFYIAICYSAYSSVTYIKNTYPEQYQDYKNSKPVNFKLFGVDYDDFFRPNCFEHLGLLLILGIFKSTDEMKADKNIKHIKNDAVLSFIDIPLWLLSCVIISIF